MKTKCTQCHRPATDRGRCDLHAARAELPKQRSWRAGEKIYKTARWRRLRNQVLNENPLCQECYKHGYISEAREVDHIVSIRRNRDLAYEKTNLRALCSPCHSRKTAQEKREARSNCGNFSQNEP